MIEFLINWLTITPSFALPFALAALGLIITEKSGVLSLGAEGFMLIGAMAGAGTLLSIGDHPALALLVSALAGSALSIVFAVMVVTLRVNQVVAGLTIVFLGGGLSGLLADEQGWTSRPLTGLQPLHFGPLTEIPLLGHILFGQDAMVYLTILIFAATGMMLSRSVVGLKLRAVGDGPEAADAAGVNVALYRYGATIIGAALVGLAGGYLSVGLARIWVDDMVGGRGWIAIALVIFARWQPWRALFGALLFGSLEALIPRIAAAGIHVPQYFVMMTPYLATLAVMVLTSLRHTDRFEEPHALGQPHLREERR